MNYKNDPSLTKKRFTSCLVLLGLGVLVILAFRFLSAPSGPLASATATPTNRPVVARATPTLLPVAGGVQAGWKAIKSICTKVEISYPTDWKTPPQDTVEQDLRRIFSAAGMQAVAAGATCEAILVVTLKGEAIKSSYTGMSACYQSARYSGKITLSAAGKNPLEKAVSGATTSPSSIKESECIKSPEYMNGASTARAIAVLGGLQYLWGDAILVNALSGDGAGNSFSIQAREDLIDLKQKALPILAQGLKYNEASIRQSSAEVIASLMVARFPLTKNDVELIRADALKTALPALVVALDDEVAQVRTTALQALDYITEKNFNSAEEWKKWWSEKK